MRLLSFIALYSVAGPATAQNELPSATSPEQAAGQALQQCVAHSLGMGTIAPGNAAQLRRNGVVISETPPEQLRAMIDNPYGHGTIAGVPSTEGAVWAVGYDSGVCIVMTVGTPVAPVEKRLKELFAIPNGFKPEKIEQRSGAVWTAWRWRKPSGDLVAQMNVRDLPATVVNGMVMVTLAPKPHGAK